MSEAIWMLLDTLRRHECVPLSVSHEERVELMSRTDPDGRFDDTEIDAAAAQLKALVRLCELRKLESEAMADRADRVSEGELLQAALRGVYQEALERIAGNHEPSPEEAAREALDKGREFAAGWGK